MTVLRRVVTPLAGSAAGVLLLGGVAYAWYSAAVTSGTVVATTIDTSTTLTLDVTGTASTGLYPGGAGAAMTVTVANPYPHPVTVTAVAAAGPVVAAPLAGRTCAVHGVAVTAPSSGLPVTVPASSSASVTLAGVVVMGTNADNGCQGATFTVPLRLTGRLS